MGRAIVRDPQAFLFDEPLSNLDAKLRVQMRTEIARIQKKYGTTTVYVTHDQTEAMTLGDRVAVLKKGVVQQVDSPRNLYNSPDNLFVAGFIGSPSMNLLPGRLKGTSLSCRSARSSCRRLVRADRQASATSSRGAARALRGRLARLRQRPAPRLDRSAAASTSSSGWAPSSTPTCPTSPAAR
jgi:ABC-type sugar transport system ATPase subunit